MIIAIDGPAGSGKSTVSKILAKRLGFLYLDTGAMYRALTLKVLQDKIDPADEKKVTQAAADLDFKFAGSRVFLDGNDVGDAIRTPEIDKAISAVCKIPSVRKHLVRMQQDIAKNNSCVTEGRDTTTVVFPQAQVKVFLDASVEERAKRRLKDFENKNIITDVKSVKDDIIRRDTADYSRAEGPLKKANDAFVLDTTGLTIEQVAGEIYNLVQERMGRKI